MPASAFKTGERLKCRWADRTVHLCEVVERRASTAFVERGDQDAEPTKPKDFEYYVHFLEYDRRLDEWVAHDRIVSPCILKSSRSVGSTRLRPLGRRWPWRILCCA